MTEPEEQKAKPAPELTPEQARTFALEAIERYQELAADLDEARTYLYPMETRPADRRRAFLHATAAVVNFLQTTSFFSEKGVEEPITQLLFQLETVVNGTPSEDFAVRPGKRSRGLRLQTFQKECAIAVDRYIRHGVPLPKACERVVRLTEAAVSPDTVKDWRNNLSNTKLKGKEGQRYREIKDEEKDLKFSIEFVDTMVVRLGRRFKGLRLRSQANPVRDIRKPSKPKTARKPRKPPAK